MCQHLLFLPPEAGCSFSSNNFTKRRSKTNAPSHLPAIHQPPAALLICRPGKDPQRTSRGYTRGCVDLASGLPGTELGGKEEPSKIFCAEARQQRVPSPPSVQRPLALAEPLRSLPFCQSPCLRCQVFPTGIIFNKKKK